MSKQRSIKSPAGKTTQVKRSAKTSQRAPRLTPPITLHVLSDSTGNLAQHMLTAFLTQFPREAFNIDRRNFLETEGKLAETLDQVAQHPGIVFHAVVSP